MQKILTCLFVSNRTHSKSVWRIYILKVSGCEDSVPWILLCVLAQRRLQIDADARSEREDLQRQRCHFFSLFCASIGTSLLKALISTRVLESKIHFRRGWLVCVCFFLLFCHLFLQVAEEPAIILVVFAKAGGGYWFIAARCKVNLSFNLLGPKNVENWFCSQNFWN